MNKDTMPLSPKYIDFCNTVTGVDVDILEGTTASGKTTVGAGVKFMRMVSRSNKKLHIIAAKTTGVAEKNILNPDYGILDIHSNAEYYGNGDKSDKIPHIKFEGKIIYILGYDNKEKWKMALGGQYGCVYIDEINTADIEFLREVSSRNEYMMGTLNPDDPSLPVYDEFINRSRPYKKYKADVPLEIMEDLEKVEPTPKWRYWFFTFNDNLSLSPEEIEKKKRSVPKGTKLYKNKILGLRGRATGLVFPNFDRQVHVKSEMWLRNRLDEKYCKEHKIKQWKLVYFTGALDTAYSSESPDTFAMSFQGITDTGVLIYLEEEVYNNAKLTQPLAPSDIAPLFYEFLERNRTKWGFSPDNFIDSADQATMTEINKFRRRNPKASVYRFNNAWKRMTIIDRIHLMLGWLNHDDGQDPYYYVLDHNPHHIREMEIYSWKEDKYEPEDRNDHTINSGQYGFIPYKFSIGER